MSTNFPPPDKSNWRALLFDYAAIADQDTDSPDMYSLSDRDIMLILTTIDYIAWKTRYINADNSVPTVDQDVIDAWKGELALHLMTPVPQEVEAPYWDEDTGDDADDSAPKDEQPWYGLLIPGESGLTWQEQISVWIVTAFVAVAGTPAAAIVFLPLAKRMILAFRAHDLGGIVKVFIDGAEAGQVDTYSADPNIVEMPLVVPPGVGGMGAADDIHTLWVSMSEDVNPAVTGTPNIQVIRKRLWEGEITPINQRYSSDCNCFEATFDDGATWVRTDAIDPRSNPALLMPPAGGDAQCAAAGGMVELVRQTVDAVLHANEIVGAANAVLAVITVLSGGAGLLIDLIIVLVEALLAIGGVVLSEAFDEDAYARLLCIFYCGTDTDGTVTEAGFAKMQALLNDEPNVIVYDAVQVMFNTWGFVTLQNAGVKFADDTADCTSCDCGWSKTWDWTTNDYSGETDTQINIGAYSPGDGISDAPVPRDTRYGSAEWQVIGHWTAGNQPTLVTHYEMDVYRPAGYDQDASGGVVYVYPLPNEGVVTLAGDGVFYDHSTENTTSHTFVMFTSGGQGQHGGMFFRRLKLSGTGHCPFPNPDP